MLRRLLTVLIAAAVVVVAGPALLRRAEDDVGGAGGGAGARASAATVERVVDGDTIVLRGGERVRYIGMDTPESVKPGTPVQCYAEKASHANERLVEGQRVRLRYDAERHDRYGRTLAYVYRARDGLFVNAELVRRGLARVLTIPPDVRHAALFRHLAARARAARRGLWGACGYPRAVPSLLLVAIFLASAAVIWVAGIQLSNATDALDARLGLGSALGGLVLLAFATNLPEIAITVTAAASGNLSLAVGNLVGGIAIQTLVLAVLDLRSHGRPLTHRVGSLDLVLEASIVIAALVAAIMTTQLPSSTNIGGVSPGSIGVAALWLAGLAIIDRARKGIPWKIEAPGSDRGRTPAQRSQGAQPQPFKGRSTPVVAAVFAGAAVVTLAAGVAIEKSGDELAGRIGLTGAVFGATILAASTALPELSTGLASVKLGDHELAFSDIFGGNAFLPVLFLIADIIAGAPSLPTAHASDVWMAGLGVVLTAVYVVGLVLRPARKLGPLGPDSWAAFVVYALGIAGLLVIG